MRLPLARLSCRDPSRSSLVSLAICLSLACAHQTPVAQHLPSRLHKAPSNMFPAALSSVIVYNVSDTVIHLQERLQPHRGTGCSLSQACGLEDTFQSFLKRKANSAAAPRSMLRLLATSPSGSAPGALPSAPITCVVAIAAPIEALTVKKPKNTSRSALGGSWQPSGVCRISSKYSHHTAFNMGRACPCMMQQRPCSEEHWVVSLWSFARCPT